MALPTSPPISLNQIKAEFGATGTRSLTQFYRGGTFVPNTSANSNVPTSGSISLLDFLGASARVNLGGSISSINVENTQGPTPPGPISVELFGTSTASPTDGSGSYTYRWSIISGSAQPSGSTTSRTFTIKANVLGNGESTGQVQCIISDGVQSITRTASYRLRYNRLT